MTDMARLTMIREQLDAIAPAEWVLASAGERLFIESTGLMGEISEIATFHADASSDEMRFAASAPQNVRFLLGLVDRAIDAAKKRQAGTPSTRQTAKKHDVEKDYAAEAAMKCADPAFRVFLEQCHGLERPLTDDRVAQKLRSVLGITSRRNLNSNADAAARWKDLRAAFEAWRKAGQ